MARVDAYLRELKEKGGSDLHITAGRPPLLRLHGELEPIRPQPLTQDEILGMILEMAGKEGMATFEKSGDHDLAYAIPGVARFRCNLFRQERGAGAVLRIIPEKILTLEQLKAPPALHQLTTLQSGLVLVTGPTGSGKSTTMAAIIDAINENYVKHIITIEDPVEFVHKRKKSVLTQREVGQHTKSFAAALRAAIREDPDVLLVGEMRDRETISLALTAAEMGILVFGTLHTNSAAKTIDRVVDAFPEDEQTQARSSLSESLAAVVAQLLLRTADGKGRAAVHEILLRTNSLGNLIREGNTAMLANVIQSGKTQGMQTMDDCLWATFQDGRISAEEAYSVAADKKRFAPLLEKPDDLATVPAAPATPGGPAT
jgi:twitching motility protein PilT